MPATCLGVRSILPVLVGFIESLTRRFLWLAGHVTLGIAGLRCSMMIKDTLTPKQIVGELDKYIIGQDDAKRAVAIAVRNRWRRQQLEEDLAREVAPKNIIMVGPTGVGKTEMAKGLAELLFGQEERLIRFDMSEYAASHADQKLLGAPPGYVGYEEGGKLTNAMKQQPFSVLLFDEIEKAHSSIFDKFLQIIDDGRLTDGKGETVYFSESIIIFTSNLGTFSQPDGASGARQQLVDSTMPYGEVRGIILAAIRHHFNQVLGRPEILNRFGENFVIFDFIRPPVDAEIVDRLLQQLLISIKEQQQIRLELDPQVRDSLIGLARANLEHGGRGIRNILDAALINPLASALFDHGIEPGASVKLVRLIDHGAETGRRFELELSLQGEL